jgi:dTDP-4-amino-4,6-dideoxygalactose transaminase
MKTINYGRQFIDNRDFNSIKKSLGEEKITTGKFVNLFEKNLRKYL